MKKSQICYAIWPWGSKAIENMETAMREVREVGYRSIEIGKQTIPLFDMKAARCQELLDRYGLKAESFYFNIPSRGREQEAFVNLEKEMQFVAELGIKRVCLQAVYGRPEGDVMDDVARAHNLNLMIKFAEIAKQFDVETNVHPHVDTYLMYEDEIDFVMQNTDPDLIHFTPDTAHLAAAGANPVEVIRRYADRVNFTHLKDYRLGDQIASEGWVDSGVPIMDCFRELGAGTVDFPEIFNVLDKAGYTGHLCVELDRSPSTNMESAKKNFEYISNLLED